MQKYIALAKRVSAICGIRWRWIYCQMYHETAGFTSSLCVDYCNCGGITQTLPNDLPQPDGNFYYRKFSSLVSFGNYFGFYLNRYDTDGVHDATTMYEYVLALKNGGYFGDSVDNYYGDMRDIYLNTFGEELFNNGNA